MSRGPAGLIFAGFCDRLKPSRYEDVLVKPRDTFPTEGSAYGLESGVAGVRGVVCLDLGFVLVGELGARHEGALG